MCSQISPACSSTPSHRADAPAATPYRATRSALTAVTSSRGCPSRGRVRLAHGTAFAGFEFEEPVRTIAPQGQIRWRPVGAARHRIADRRAPRRVARQPARTGLDRRSPTRPTPATAARLQPIRRPGARPRRDPQRAGARRPPTDPRDHTAERLRRAGPPSQRRRCLCLGWIPAPRGATLAGRRRAHNRGHGGGCRGTLRAAGASRVDVMVVAVVP